MTITAEPTAPPPPDPPPIAPPTAGLGGGSGLTRITVNLHPRAVAALDRLTEATGATKTELINRSLQVHELVNTLVTECGGRLSIVVPDGTRRDIYLL